MIESCSKMTVGELNDAKKATCWLRIPCALGTKRFGNPSAKVLQPVALKSWSAALFLGLLEIPSHFGSLSSKWGKHLYEHKSTDFTEEPERSGERVYELQFYLRRHRDLFLQEHDMLIHAKSHDRARSWMLVPTLSLCWTITFICMAGTRRHLYHRIYPLAPAVVE